MLDILFEHRNKAYGAYTLRRQYPVHLVRGVSGSLLLSAAFALLLWYSTGNTPPLVSLAATPVEVTPVILPPQQTETPPPATSGGAAARTVRDVVPIVVPDNTAVDHPVPSVDDLADAIPALDDGPGEPGQGTSANGVPAGTSPLQADPAVPAQPAIYDFSAVEIPAQFPGGAKALKRFLERHLRVPEPDAGDAGGQVKVLVRFVVGADGRTGQPELLDAGGAAYDQEVLRVLALMPRWTPARQNQHDVAMYFILPIVFDRITDQ